jgi:hypothetical protein
MRMENVSGFVSKMEDGWLKRYLERAYLGVGVNKEIEDEKKEEYREIEIRSHWNEKEEEFQYNLERAKILRNARGADGAKLERCIERTKDEVK